MKISVITGDKYLKAQAELMLSECAEVSFSWDKSADITLLDIDTEEDKSNNRANVIRLSRQGGVADATIPLPFSFYSSLISDKLDTQRLTVSRNKKECSVDGQVIRLTAHEYALLSLLVSKKGDYASRDEISCAVFGGGGDNMINLYVHYLREKLETGSERIILSSRKLGYSVNVEFLGGKTC